jgi:deoxyribose-phosphate aldolase
MLAGADFIKTSTGKVAPAATLPVTLVMLEAVRDWRAATGGPAGGQMVGVKAAGGIRTTKDAVRFIVTVHETAGDDWLSARYFRIGASSLLNDLLMQRDRMATGRYSGPDYVTVD